MNNIHSEFVKADKLIQQFCSKEEGNAVKFVNRFSSLMNDINAFIEVNKYEKKVMVNELMLGYMLLDYFEDVRRLKEYHEVGHINAIKIVAYTSYWFLRRHPIEILKNEKELVYVNERFVLAYILNFLDGGSKAPIIYDERKGVQSFADMLFYFIKYRANNANAFEMILTAFFAGRIYQEKDEDLSEKMGHFKKEE